MALSLGDRDRDFGRADFLALGEQLGLRLRPVERALDDLVQQVEIWIDDLSTLPFDGAVTHKLRRVVEYRRGRIGRT